MEADFKHFSKSDCLVHSTSSINDFSSSSFYYKYKYKYKYKNKYKNERKQVQICNDYCKSNYTTDAITNELLYS